jgi:hypothetical protein
MTCLRDSSVLWVVYLAALLGVGYVALLVRAYDDCDKKNGTLVQGVFWYECVAPPSEEE